MARIELSNIGGGGGGSTTLALTTTGTSGASVLTTVSGGYSLNIPVYQGALSLSTAGTSGASTLVGDTLTIPTYQGQISLTTTGTSGASTFVGNTLNIPTYQGAISLTTTGTSGAATLVGNTLNVPQYSTAPAGSTGEIQYNSAGAFAASANLSWDNSNVRLNIGAPLTPTGRLNVKGGGSTSATNTSIWTNSGNTELLRIRDDGRIGVGSSSPAALLNVSGSVTASGAIARTQLIDGTLVAAANSDALIGLDILPTFSNSSFSNVDNLALRVRGLARTATGNNGGIISFRNDITTTASAVSYVVRICRQNSNTPAWYLGNDGNDDAVFVTNNANMRIGKDFSGTFSEYMRIFVTNGNITFQNGGTYTDNGYRLDVISAGSTHGLRARAPNASSGTNALLVQNTTVSDLYKIEADGKISYWATNTAAGTTGAQTINRPSGTVNFAAGASALVVTNSLCTTASLVFAEVRTNDATAQIKNVVPAAGSFTINLSAAATAETSVGFFIIN